MPDDFVQVSPDSTGKKIDTSSLTVGANTVQRERDVVADPTDPAALAQVLNTDPAGTEYGLCVRPVGSISTGGLTDAQLRATPVPVSGTFFQATQPVSAASLRLPTGAATAANQATGNTSLANLDVALSTRTKPADQQHTIIDSGTTVVTQPTGTNLHVVVDSAPSTVVSGTVAVSNFPATQPVSGTVAATQSGTWTVQPGNTANTTAWKVDGSAVTQPVSGSVTANAGTNLNTSALALDATLTGGTQKSGQVTPTTSALSAIKIDSATTGDIAVIAAVAAQTVRVFRMLLICNSAATLVFKDGAAGTALTGAMNMQASGSVTLDFQSDPWFVTSAGNAFVINQTGTAQLSGRIWYTQS